MPSAILQSPLGPILIEAADRRLTSIRINVTETLADKGGDDPLLADAVAQLNAYFDAERSSFDLPLAPAATPRGEALRAAIVAIEYGETASYGVLARTIASSPRAIGQACARNPFPIVVPCHRITGAGDAIGNYSAGAGIATKRWLLNHERRK